jgi:hypothetical protein
MRIRGALLAGIGGMVVALSASPPPAVAARNCVGAEQASAHASGGDGGPPKFSRAFYAHVFTLDASLDGLAGNQLPISIEEVCSVPKSLKAQAVQVAGTDGVALLSANTSVWSGKQHLTGSAALTAVDGADTALLRVRLAPPRRWSEDEDGNKVPTFAARRIQITD